MATTTTCMWTPGSTTLWHLTLHDRLPLPSTSSILCNLHSCSLHLLTQVCSFQTTVMLMIMMMMTTSFDNSPDGTQEVAKQLAVTYGNKVCSQTVCWQTWPQVHCWVVWPITTHLKAWTELHTPMASTSALEIWWLSYMLTCLAMCIDDLLPC